MPDPVWWLIFIIKCIWWNLPRVSEMCLWVWHGGILGKHKESEEGQPWTWAEPPHRLRIWLTKKNQKDNQSNIPLLCLLVYANMSKQPSTSTVMPSLLWWADYTLETSAKPNPSSIKFLLLRYLATEAKKYLTGACCWGVCSWATGGSKHPHQQSLITMGKLRQFCLFQVPLPLAPLDMFNAEKFLINQTSRDIISGD